MADCSLPDKFCCCYSLKSGGKFIAGLCLTISVIACVFISIYLFSDLEEIAEEIAVDDENAEVLKEDGTCKLKLKFKVEFHHASVEARNDTHELA
jgi:hypothetical protein